MMNLLPETTPKTFNLLSIGQRVVGKTVFLTGSYAELHSHFQPDLPRHLWFDSQNSQVQEKIERVLSYIAETGQYPPPTIKITDFNFSLKRRNLWGTQTLCHFNWWDVPGESCNADNPDFQRIVANSHGCCVFIDAFELVNNDAYLQVLEEDIILQAKALAELVSLNGLKYAFALILTKCDLLEPGPRSRQQIEEGLQLLTTHLDALRANYQMFYSAIPIVQAEGISTLRAQGAAAPLLWLVWELSKADRANSVNNPLKLVTRLLPSHSHLQQGSNGLTQNLHSTTGKVLGVKKIWGLLELRLRLLPTPHRYILILILVLIGSVGVTGLLLTDYKWVLQRQPSNLNVSQEEPEHLRLRLQLAQSYETVGQVAEAEALYDEVLTEQKNNLNALVNKAVLRNAQGDTKTAEALFTQAEKAAPTKFKARVRAVAQKTLQSPAKSVPSVR